MKLETIQLAIDLSVYSAVNLDVRLTVYLSIHSAVRSDIDSAIYNELLKAKDGGYK